MLCIISKSLNINDIISFQNKNGSFIFYTPTIAVLFIITTLIETNRAPFDLAESESELVAGFHVEYSGFLFAMFFLAEYSFMAFNANFFCIIFLGQLLASTNFKLLIIYGLIVCSLYFIFILIRAVFPRIRFDQLIILC